MTLDKMNPGIEAELTFLTADEGGRRSPVRSGYRVVHDFYGMQPFTDAVHVYPGREEVHPGETAIAELTLFAPESHRGRLSPGMLFVVREGARVVARGRILRLLDESLLRP